MKINWIKTMFITGLILLILGMIDPLEGSVLVGVGAVLIAIYGYLVKDRFRSVFLVAAISIIAGILFMFYLSSRGGIGEGALPKIWFATVVPYPAGWLLLIFVLIYKAVKKEFIFKRV